MDMYNEGEQTDITGPLSYRRVMAFTMRCKAD